MAEAQKQQILTEQKMQLEKAKSDFEVQKMEREAQIKQQLMELEFNYNMQLTQAQGGWWEWTENRSRVKWR